MLRVFHNKVLLITLILLCLCSGAYSQVLNVEELRLKSDTTGFFGGGGINYNISQNQKRMTNAGLNIHVAYKTQKSYLLLINRANIIRLGSENFANQGYQHLRYNKKLNSFITAEVFGQWQFNQLLKIKNRELIGLGPRFKLFSSNALRLYAGIMGMYEYEEISNGSIDRFLRMSNYFSITIKLNNTATYSSTTYYQPVFSDFSNYRISTEHDFTISITKHIGFVSSFELLYNSNPPKDVVNRVFELKNGLTYKFK